VRPDSKSPAKQNPADTRLDPALQLLEFFYPFHYRIGMALEGTLRAGKLTRLQTAILWLIRHEGEGGRRIQRKRIERLLSDWFEVSSAAVTKSVRAMARPPLSLVQMAEDPNSGREKQVWLTRKGERFLEQMVERGRNFVAELARRGNPEDVSLAIELFRRMMAPPPSEDGRKAWK
jgi:DNA-binding MarR family transcriptional regulator